MQRLIKLVHLPVSCHLLSASHQSTDDWPHLLLEIPVYLGLFILHGRIRNSLSHASLQVRGKSCSLELGVAIDILLQAIECAIVDKVLSICRLLERCLASSKLFIGRPRRAQ